MRAPCICLAAAIGIAACATSPSTADEFTPRYHSWERIMEQVMEPTWERHLEPVLQTPIGDLDLTDVAARAEHARRYLEHAMAGDPHASIAGFADAEAAAARWLDDIATTARGGDGAALQALIRDGESRYCDRCHDLLP